MMMAAAAVVCDKCVLLVLSKSRHQEGWLIGFFELFVAIVSYRIAHPPARPHRLVVSRSLPFVILFRNLLPSAAGQH